MPMKYSWLYPREPSRPWKAAASDFTAGPCARSKTRWPSGWSPRTRPAARTWRPSSAQRNGDDGSGGGCRRLARDAGRHGHYRRQIGQIRGHHQGRAALRQLAELLHVLLADAQLHGLDAAAIAQCDADLAQALRRCRRHGQNRLGLTFGFVDLLLLVGLGLLDHALLVALSGVDLGIALALRGQYHGTLFAFRAHLL